VLRLAALDSIGVGEFGASALQKEAMRISKIDTIRIAIKKVKREDCLRYLLHDCRDQKTGKKLKEISLSLLID
jgi:hypothetical protein